MTLFVKNMTCESCKAYVRLVLKAMGITPLEVSLGEVLLYEKLTKEQEEELKKYLKRAYLYVLEEESFFLIEKVKHLLIYYVMGSDMKPKTKYSSIISSEINKDYAYISNCFSQIEKCTIEKYIIKLKIERIKELIVFGELTITEIAYKMHYSSPGHLSNQFKQETGLSPSEFKNLKENKRLILQKILISDEKVNKNSYNFA